MKFGMAALGLLLVCSAQAGDLPAPAGSGELDKPYLYEVLRHLYRWYLDEDDVARVKKSGAFTFWIVPLELRLDEGDRSRLAKIYLPQLDVSVKVKKADYVIEETGTDAKSRSFKITNVAREEHPDQPPEDAQVVTVAFKDMIDDLFQTRNAATYPEGDFLLRLRMAVRKRLLPAGGEPPQGTQIVHLSPISPAANELWVYWESGRTLIRFASDIDLANAAVWEHDDLNVETYNIDEQVVVSFDEAPGSNRFLARDQVGRVLYNCMVFGRRVELEPLSAGQGEDETTAIKSVD